MIDYWPSNSPIEIYLKCVCAEIYLVIGASPWHCCAAFMKMNSLALL